jgi:hypothetical protein
MVDTQLERSDKSIKLDIGNHQIHVITKWKNWKKEGLTNI